MPNNMGFTPPPVGQEGPEWAENINDILNTNIADHDHTSGKGIPVTPAGMNIDSDLSMNANNLIDAKTVRLQELASTASFGAQDINALYDYNGDLYFVDGNQTAIRITQGGGLSPNTGGQINGLSGSSGEANFAAGTFEWLKQGSPNKEYANMENGPVFVYSGNDTNPANSVQLRGVDSLASNSILQLSPVNITLPQAHPAATSFVTMSAAGVMGAGPVTAQGITNPFLAPVTFFSSSTTASFNLPDGTVPTAYVAVPRLSGTLTTTGRPVEVRLYSNAGAVSTNQGGGFVVYAWNTTNGNDLYIRTAVTSGSTNYYLGQIISVQNDPSTLDLPNTYPASIYSGIIFLPAGTYDFQIEAQMQLPSTPDSFVKNNTAIFVREL